MSSSKGKFLICIPRLSGGKGRFRVVARAVVRIAEMLEKDVEVSNRRNVMSVWVYYKDKGRKESLLYSDWGKDWSEDEVFRTLRSMAYTLSYFAEENAILQAA